MTFAIQYEQALTVKPASARDTSPSPLYFAGNFYELLDSTAHRLPTILSGGSMDIFSDLTLSYKPLDCRLLLYTHKGSGRLLMHGQNHVLETRSLLYLDCRSSFSLVSDSLPWHFDCFWLSGELLAFYESLIPFQDFSLTQPAVHSAVLRNIKLLLAGSVNAALQNKLNDANLISAILTELFIETFHLETESQKNAPYLKELKHFLDNYFAEPFRLEELEKRYHMSKYRICREFSAAFGIPPLKYLNQRRLNAAVNLLLSTDQKVHEIALKVGYENTNHFINLFKKEYNTTPQAYREAHLH